jgi:hypothetical protein
VINIYILIKVLLPDKQGRAGLPQGFLSYGSKGFIVEKGSMTAKILQLPPGEVTWHLSVPILFFAYFLACLSARIHPYAFFRTQTYSSSSCMLPAGWHRTKSLSRNGPWLRLRVTQGYHFPSGSSLHPGLARCESAEPGPLA